MTTDLIIIGAGPGGYDTAARAARYGLSVVIIEQDKLGGTCLNAGCIPTKALAHSAETIHALSHAEGINYEGNLSVDMAAIVRRKNAIVAQLTDGIASLMSQPAITLVKGTAHFVDDHTVSVDNNTYTAPHIIIATGSVSKSLPIEGATLPGVLTSTEILNLSERPDSLCIIGGGVIGLEIASIFNTFGTQVTVVEYCKEVLPTMDRDIAKRLRTSLRKSGINFLLGAAVDCIATTADGQLAVSYTAKASTATITAAKVLMAVGRIANTANLNLEATHIAVTPRGITVDDNMQTNVSGVYAIGDVNGRCQLAHAAYFQGRRALNHILQRADNIDLQLVPAAVFTMPPMASVGKREEDYVTPPRVFKAYYRANGRALTMDAPDGFIKVIAATDGTIEGIHILGAGAPELIHEATVLMAHHDTIDQLKDIIHAHPTLSEIYTNLTE